MGSASPANFSGPTVQIDLRGFLFDMDGTIIDSTTAVEKHWHTIGKEIGVSPEVILQTSHGRRSIDTLKIHAPEKANWKYICQMEGLIPKLHGHDAVEIPGARALLTQIIDFPSTSTAASAPWAIITSGTEPLVHGWLTALSLPTPPHLVTAESVDNGKPDPACYQLGLNRLGLSEHAGEVLVLEDSPAGIRAGKAAGCKVLGLVTSHSAEQVRAAEPDWVVKDLESVRVVGAGERGTVRVEIRGTLVGTER